MSLRVGYFAGGARLVRWRWVYWREPVSSEMAKDLEEKLS